MSAALLAYLAARKRHKNEKKRRAISSVIDALKDDEDREDERIEAARQEEANAEAKMERQRTLQRERANETFMERWFRRVMDFLGQVWLQMLQYIAMLYCFQSLAGTIRLDTEFYFDTYVNSMVVANTFDSRHYNLPKVHKIGDVYGWMENALTPALFHNAPEGQSWPDGDGLFSHVGSTPYSTADMVNEANIFSLPEGIVFKQLRMHAKDPAKYPCYANHSCYLQLEGEADPGDVKPFGRANSHMSAGHFKWWPRSALGANTGGVPSASHISGRLYDSSGFVAAFRPFFSDTLLPDEEGPTPQSVRDFRLHEATPRNGRPARYRCARYSTNGNHTVQRCDPGVDGATGVTRAMFAELVRFLKRGHWIDRQTALVSVSMQVSNQNEGVRFATRYIFEFSPLGGVLPSYDTESLIDNADVLTQRDLWLDVCLALIGWFSFLEGIEILTAVRSCEIVGYLSSMWNLLDWINYTLFYYVYILCKHERFLVERDESGTSCSSHLCQNFGYFDSWEVFAVGRLEKLLLSFIVCIQFLKIIKFTNELVPKMSLMTRVLTKASADLVFFAFIFAISMFAFSNLFYMQLGSAVDNYYSLPYSVISLTRSLFGDFDIVEINENSKDYLNGVLYLFYLFISVFILLALFLAILGEAQSAVRDDQYQAEANGEDVDAMNGLGILNGLVQCGRLAVAVPARLLGLDGAQTSSDDAEESLETEEQEAQRLIAESLSAFKPNFLRMLESHLARFEATFGARLEAVEAALEARQGRQAAYEARRRVPFARLERPRTPTPASLTTSGDRDRDPAAKEGRPKEGRQRKSRHSRGRSADRRGSASKGARSSGKSGERRSSQGGTTSAPPPRARTHKCGSRERSRERPTQGLDQ